MQCDLVLCSKGTPPTDVAGIKPFLRPRQLTKNPQLRSRENAYSQPKLCDSKRTAGYGNQPDRRLVTWSISATAIQIAHNVAPNDWLICCDNVRKIKCLRYTTCERKHCVFVRKCCFFERHRSKSSGCLVRHYAVFVLPYRLVTRSLAAFLASTCIQRSVCPYQYFM